MTADYPLSFINSVINESENGKDHKDESHKIPSDLFGITKPFISIEITHCKLSKIRFKLFLKKFHKSTNDGFRVVTTWKTRTIHSLLKAIGNIK